ncbi:hypothetical protein E4K66_29425 [Bradyrhizobium frederickii]|uniref:Uncharacterized protein n=1 Tax=Bradyrhizobium frederickii TaxID=2560054 RepID=A0A4Y9KWU8_9BRAD|nr:hypothetical protein E4K66_29425 [Bradyrhizobium frederickii]
MAPERQRFPGRAAPDAAGRPFRQDRARVRLKRDAIRMDRHRALGCCSSMIFSENRCALFRIML